MSETPNLGEALVRLRGVFNGTSGVGLVDTDVAELAGLDDAGALRDARGCR